GDRLADGLHVASVEVSAERVMPVDDLGEVVLAKLSKRLGQIVHHESVVIREELDPHLRQLPAWHVVVDAVDDLVGVALACAPWSELNKVVIRFAEREEANQEEQFEPPVEV